MQSSFISTLLQTCIRFNDKIAIVDRDGKRETTYGELLLLARKASNFIRNSGVPAGSFICVRMEDCMEFIAAEIGVWISRCAVVPVGTYFPQARAEYISGHCESPLTITIEDFKTIRSLDPAEPEMPEKDADALVFYTSGSSGVPKGVVDTFGTLDFMAGRNMGKATLCEATVYCFSQHLTFTVVTDLYQALSVGATTHIFTDALRTNVHRIEEYVCTHAISMICLPPATVKLFHNRSKTLKVVTSAGEKITSQCSKEGYTLVGLYGMTETGGLCFVYESPEGEPVNGRIGKPVDGVQRTVIDGELCLKGPLCKGYLKDPEMTAALYDKDGWLHTGDLVSEDEEGNTIYLNRRDWMLKVGGLRIEPGEIESVMLKATGVKEAVVKGFDDGNGSQYLAGFYVSDSVTPDSLREVLAKALPTFMVPAFLIKLDRMPVNTNGKCDRKSLTIPENLLGDEEIVEPEGDLEVRLKQIAGEILGRDRFGVTTNLIGMGLTSLSAMKFNAAILEKTGKSISTKDLMSHPSIREIASLMKEPHSENISFTSVHEKTGYYPLSENQRIIWLEWERNKDSIQFNIPTVWKMDCNDVQEYAGAIRRVIDAHPVLKATIEMKDGEYVMARHDEAESKVEIIELAGEPSKEQIRAYIRPFNLDGGELYRAIVLKVGGSARTVTILDIHHCISDGLSVKLIMNDICKVLGSEEIKDEQYTYFDHCLNERDILSSTLAAEAESYFDELLEGTEVTVYPGAEPDGSKANFAIESIEMPRKDIDAFCSRHGFTQANYFLAMFLHLMHEVSREETVLITTINNGRYDTSEFDTVGMFVKTLPVVSRRGGADGVVETVATVQEQFMRTVSMDYYPLSRIVEKHPVRSEILFEYQVGIENDDVWKRMHAQRVQIDSDMSITPVTVSITNGMSDAAAYSLNVRYIPASYSKRSMMAMLRMLKTISNAAVKADSMSSLPLVDKFETNRIIELSAGPVVDFGINRTFAEAFVKCAAAYPERTAVADSEGEHSYRNLDNASNLLAGILLDKGLKKDGFVALLLERTWFFPLSIISVHKAGGAYVPLDIDYPVDRLQYMLSDSGAGILVTTHNDFDRKCSVEGLEIDTDKVSVLYLDDLDFGADAEPVNLASSDGLAYMIYTSGSTGRPKGVILHQAGLWNFIESIKSLYHHSKEDRIGAHRAFSFVAHVEDTYAILTVGGSLHIMPSSIRKDLDSIYGFLVDNRITGCGFTTSLSKMMIENYDLPLRYITAGGEKLSGVVSTGHPQIINVYGPTECTDHTSVHFLETGREYDNIPVGKTLANNWCFVTSLQGHLVPEGVPGELCFAGIQVGRGYNNLDELTARSFVDCPFVKEDRWSRKVRMYHTGDLVRWNEEGILEHLGRIDGQVKIRGYRVEPGEIESAVAKMEGIESVAVRILDIGGGKAICLYYSAPKGCTAPAESEVSAFVQECGLAEYMRPEYYVRMDTMPRLPNAKINRRALPEPEYRQEDIVVPQTPTQKALHAIVGEILKGIETGIDTNLVSAGLSSLSAMRMCATVQQRCGWSLSTSDILRNLTIRSIADAIDNGTIGMDKQIAEIHPLRQYYPVSENQRGVYIDWELNRNALQYNIPLVRKITSNSAEEVARALRQIVNAHPVLKAGLATVDGDVMMRRRDEAEPVISTSAIDFEPDEQFFRNKVKPFDLLQDDLYRMEVITAPGAVYLFSDIHHIICDGTTSALFSEELDRVLKGEGIVSESYTAFDRVLDEQQMRRGNIYHRAEKYFEGLLSDYAVASYPHSRIAEGEGSAHVTVRVRGAGIKSFCKSNAFTLNSFFLTMLTQTLHRTIREDKLLITSVTSGRSTAEMQKIFGMFVQTVPVVTADSGCSVVETVHAMQDQFIRTQSCSIFPYTELVGKYGCKSEIMFAFQGGVFENAASENGTVRLELDTVKVPLIFMVVPYGEDDFNLDLEFDKSLYNKSDMLALAQAVSQFCDTCATAPDKLMKEIPLVSTGQEERLETLGRGESLEYDTSETLPDILRRQSLTVPDNLFLSYGERNYTYAEVNLITDKLARYLVGQGIRDEQTVGVMIGRGELMFLFSMAIMKAGGTYMPLDPHFPEDRLMFMCGDASIGLILTEDNLATTVLPAFKGRIIDRSQLNWAFDSGEDDAGPALPQIKSENRMVILYTSGSTGKPKGVELEQHGIVNFCHWYVREFEMTASDRALAYANYGFDAHMIDFYPTMLAGASVYILDDEVRMDLVALNEFIERNGVTIAFMTTQIGTQIATMFQNKSLRVLSTGGEKMPPINPPSYRLVNPYGPTECSLFSTFYNVKDYFEGEFIGGPIANYQLHIVDKYMNPVPEGIQGELIIGGTGVARGYLNREDLTKEKFIGFKGKRFYRSGDLVKWSIDPHDGSEQIEFIGRIDGQVKLRGLRIELGEIENRVLQFEGIRQACADVKESNGGQILCCYYTLSEEVDSIDEPTLLDFLHGHLADFMIPDFLMKLDTMPLTPNGKVNRKALPVPDTNAVTEYVEPRNETEQFFCQAVGKVLNLDKVGATDNFFRIGGTSILAMRLAVIISEGGFKLHYKDIFDNPTPEQMASFASGRTETALDTEIRDYDYSGFKNILSNNSIETFVADRNLRNLGSVLLTGATGFLGIHVLRELLSDDGVTDIYCLVRTRHIKPVSRLKMLLFYYFEDEFSDAFDSRLHVIDGDITDPSAFEKVGKVDTVINCAANVKHFSADSDLEDINVGGVRNCVEYCLKHDARFIQTSTCSVGGRMVSSKPCEAHCLAENEFYFGQELSTKYSRSKFIAERDILHAVMYRGLKAKIMRLGNLSSRSSDGEFQINFRSNAFLGRLKSFQILKAIPYSMLGQEIEFSPIDEVAKAICLLSKTNDKCLIFHPNNSHRILMADVIDCMNRIGCNIKEVEEDTFREILDNASEDRNKVDILQSLLAYQSEETDGKYRVNNVYGSIYTTQVLFRLGFYWNTTTWDYVLKFLRAISSLGLFDENYIRS